MPEQPWPLPKVLLFALGILLVSLAALGILRSTSHQPEQVTLVNCYDGDTCRVAEHQQSIRLIGIDAPELAGPCPELAQQSRQILLSFLHQGESLWLERQGFDRYGRIRGTLYIKKGSRLYSANEAMVNMGYAFTWQPGTIRRDSCTIPAAYQRP